MRSPAAKQIPTIARTQLDSPHAFGSSSILYRDRRAREWPAPHAQLGTAFHDRHWRSYRYGTLPRVGLCHLARRPVRARFLPHRRRHHASTHGLPCRDDRRPSHLWLLRRLGRVLPPSARRLPRPLRLLGRRRLRPRHRGLGHRHLHALLVPSRAGHRLDHALRRAADPRQRAQRACLRLHRIRLLRPQAVRNRRFSRTRRLGAVRTRCVRGRLAQLHRPWLSAARLRRDFGQPCWWRSSAFSQSR